MMDKTVHCHRKNEYLSFLKLLHKTRGRLQSTNYIKLPELEIHRAPKQDSVLTAQNVTHKEMTA